MRFGPDSSMISLDRVKTSSWYREGMESVYSYWGGLTDNYSEYSVIEQVIPIFVNLADPGTGKQLGHMLLFLDPALFSDCYSSLFSNTDGQIYLMKSDGHVLSSSNGEKAMASLTPQTQKVLLRVLSEESSYPNPVKYFESTSDSVPQIVTYQYSDNTGWVLAEILPITQLQEQETPVFDHRRRFGFGCGGAYRNPLPLPLRQVDKTVNQMLARVKQISEGSFYPAPESLEETPRDELGLLSVSIDQMQSDIDRLIQDNINKEKEKRDYEMQMLQTQINPHFLYGTLNTIKLMATFQGATGIEKMLVALGRILRYSLGGGPGKGYSAGGTQRFGGLYPYPKDPP